MGELACQIKEYIQPFERRLALQELNALTDGPVVPINGSHATATAFSIPPSSDAATLRERLAYWRSVGNGRRGLTTQLRVEATLGIAPNGMAISELRETVRRLVPSRLPNKRCLRYATHGLHEYRGKFFPQLVRAFMNIAKLPKDAVVLDPMCGSGTTLVEARLSGRKCYGLDMNPLSVFVSHVKCQALTLRPEALATAYAEITEAFSGQHSIHGEPLRYLSLADQDRDYIQRWFSPRILNELHRIESAISGLPTKPLRNFYWICLSNILRAVSWQKTEDLRIRREESEPSMGETIDIFLDTAGRSTRTVLAFLLERGRKRIGTHKVHEADARSATSVLPQLVGKVDAVITSPPYATALPYIDTDRLSLIYLGLLERADHRARDGLMIGNREVTERIRAAQWEFYEANRTLLPGKTRTLIERIDYLNKVRPSGFRRKNLSALLSKYFFDMREVLQQMFFLLRPGGEMFLVVGNNRTTAGGQPIQIRTANHLKEIALSLDFQVVEDLSMDMLVSRDIFKNNAVASEQIIRFKKPQ